VLLARARAACATGVEETAAASTVEAATRVRSGVE
jgi:hypothetical protein